MNSLKGKTIMFLYVQILPEFMSRIVLKVVKLFCWGIIKVKILYKISGMMFSSLELKLSGFAVKPPPMKGLIGIGNRVLGILMSVRAFKFQMKAHILCLI